MELLWIVVAGVGLLFLVRLVIFIRHERKEMPRARYVARIGRVADEFNAWDARIFAPGPVSFGTKVAASAWLVETLAQMNTWDVPHADGDTHEAWRRVLESHREVWLSGEGARGEEATQALQLLLQEMRKEPPPSGGFRGTVIGAFLFGFPR